MAKKKLTIEDVLVPKDEIPYEVPENWCWTYFGYLCKLNNGYAFKSTQYKESGLPILRISNINSFGIDFESAVYSEENKELERFEVKKGDLLIAMSGATTGKTGVYNLDKKAYLNQRVGNLKIVNNLIISEKYRNYFILHKSEEILKLAYGGAQPNISGKMIDSMKIPLPPLTEQERIVKRIESLFEKIDKAYELVEEARDGFEKRRAAILEMAFSGELTKKWREENDFSVESIIKKIEELNKSEKKKFEFTESDEIFNIPNNWKWMKLKDLCTKFKYGTSAKSQQEGNIPVLRMGNLQDGAIDWNNLVYTSNEDEIKKYDLIKGDLLFNRTNSPELVGKTSIYMGEREAIYAGYLIRVRTYENVNSKYINYFMNSTFAKARCYEVKTD